MDGNLPSKDFIGFCEKCPRYELLTIADKNRHIKLSHGGKRGFENNVPNNSNKKKPISSKDVDVKLNLNSCYLSNRKCL